jgi:hypothetical protein
MDYAVTGRTDLRGLPNPAKPFVHQMTVLSITPQSHGNAAGLGVADIIPRALAENIDLHSFYMNSVTSTYVNKASIPLVVPDEESAVKGCVLCCWRLDEENARLCIIRSTLHLNDILASPSLVAEIKGMPNIEIVGPPIPVEFSPEGRLLTRTAR